MDAGTAIDSVSHNPIHANTGTTNPSTEQARHTRSSVFERSTLSRPALGVASDFELGKSPWNASSRIWGTGASFLDGLEDGNARRKPSAPIRLLTKLPDQTPASPVRQGSSATFSQSRSVTNPQISPIENDENAVSSKAPWSTMSTTIGSLSRSRGLPLSPTKQRQNFGPDPADHSTGTLEPPSLFIGSAPDVDDEGSTENMHSPQDRRALANSTRLVQSPSNIGNHDRSRFGYQPYNNADLGVNDVFSSNRSHTTSKSAIITNGVSQEKEDLAPVAVRNGYSFGRQSASHVTNSTPRFNPLSSPYITSNTGRLSGENNGRFDTPSNQKLNGVHRSLQTLSIEQARQSTEFIPGRRIAHNTLDHPQHAVYTQTNTQAPMDSLYPMLEHTQQPYSSPVPDSHRFEPTMISSYGGLPYNARGAYSSISSDQHSNVQSPYFSTADTPPTGPDSARSTSASGFPNHTSFADQRTLDHKLRNLEPTRYDQHGYPSGPHVPSHHNSQYDNVGLGFNVRSNPNVPSYYVACTYPPTPTPRIALRELDQGSVVRSQLLEDFRLHSKTSKRFELKDIYNHIVEFSGDQHGSRFIQQKLETANSDEKEQIFKEIQPNLLQLMTDVFGNYVIQKMFEHGNQSQKKVLANQMKGHVLHLSMQMYGCRVVQKAFEHVLIDQQASLVKELHGPNFQILKVVKDQNGNHVVQKAIERIPGEHIQFIVDAHQGQVMKMSTHQYGCRVVQRMLEYCQPKARRMILNELLENIQPLILDSYGNYVVQHIIDGGDAQDRRRIVNIVLSNLLTFSKHKFASNIVEKSIQCADADQRVAILKGLTAPDAEGNTPVLGLMRDQYGNYVLQKVHKSLQGAELAALEADMKTHYQTLRRTSYGKQVTAIEKLLFGSPLIPGATPNIRGQFLQGTNGSAAAAGGMGYLPEGQGRN